jgi:hypothetical protein
MQFRSFGPTVLAVLMSWCLAMAMACDDFSDPQLAPPSPQRPDADAEQLPTWWALERDPAEPDPSEQERESGRVRLRNERAAPAESDVYAPDLGDRAEIRGSLQFIREHCLDDRPNEGTMLYSTCLRATVTAQIHLQELLHIVPADDDSRTKFVAGCVGQAELDDWITLSICQAIANR